MCRGSLAENLFDLPLYFGACGGEAPEAACVDAFKYLYEDLIWKTE